MYIFVFRDPKVKDKGTQWNKIINGVLVLKLHFFSITWSNSRLKM